MRNRGVKIEIDVRETHLGRAGAFLQRVLHHAGADVIPLARKTDLGEPGFDFGRIATHRAFVALDAAKAENVVL